MNKMLFESIGCTISWLAGSYSFTFKESDKFLTTKIVLAQNIFTFLLINHIMYLNPNFGTIGFLAARNALFLTINFMILIVFVENTLFRNIIALLMLILTTAVLSFNILHDKVAEKDERLIAALAIFS